MHACRSFLSWTVCFVFAFAAYVGTANADSDRLLITDSTGAAVFDNSIPEPPTTGGEVTLTYDGGPAPVPPPIPLTTAITSGAIVVVLTDPASEPPDPTEPPIVIAGPNGPVTVSDVVISTLGNNGAPFPFITLVSDGGPDMQQIASLLPGNPRVAFMGETGQLQPLALPALGILTVQVQSDVVPEPGTLLLLGSGLAGLAAVGARRRRV